MWNGFGRFGSLFTWLGFDILNGPHSVVIVVVCLASYLGLALGLGLAVVDGFFVGMFLFLGYFGK